MTVDYPLIFDGHNDVLETQYAPGRNRRDLLQEGTEGHLDLPRARKGGFGGGLFAVFPPGGPAGTPVDPADAKRSTDLGVAALFEWERRAQGGLRVVRDLPALRAAFQERALAAVLHFEGAEAIDPGLERLETYYAQGLRSLGLVWSRPNAFGTGVLFDPALTPDQGPGLTPEGLALVRACNRLGLVVDVSHLNEKGFWDVARTSTAPLVASHSCVYQLSRSPRNLTDAQLDAIAESGGIVGINFTVSFLREDNRSDPDTPLEVMVRHFRYVADRIGVEHVGFGSDFDGCTVTRHIHDAAGLPRLMAALAESGFGPEDLRRIAHDNWWRVLAATWKG